MTRARHAGLALLGILALTACGTTEGQTTDEVASPTQVGQDDSASEPAEPDSAEGQGPTDVTRQLDDAVQTITYPMQGHDGEITMGIFTPEVQGEAMLVSIVFEPEFADEDTEDVRFRDLHGDSANTVLMPVVSDRENFKAYHVPRETENQFVQGGGWTGGSFGTGTWASPIGDVEVRSGEQYLHWAYFPAPEDDIDTVDVAVIPGMQEFRDVEIDWGSTAPGTATTEEPTEDDA